MVDLDLQTKTASTSTAKKGKHILSEEYFHQVSQPCEFTHTVRLKQMMRLNVSNIKVQFQINDVLPFQVKRSA